MNIFQKTNHKHKMANSNVYNLYHNSKEVNLLPKNKTIKTASLLKHETVSMSY